MAQVLQSNTSLKYLDISIDYAVMRYSLKSITKFVEIVTAPESKSQLKLLIFGPYKENEDIADLFLFYRLTLMAVLRGHKLAVLPVSLDTKHNKLHSSLTEQHSKADRMPDLLLYGKK